MSGGHEQFGGRGGRGDTESEKGGRGRRQQGSKHNNRSSNRQPRNTANRSHPDSSKKRKRVLLLHGNRQTGDILLGRMDKLKKILLRELELEIVAPDAPHSYLEEDCIYFDEVDGDTLDDGTTQWQRTWWHRKENTYHGLEESISMLDELWNSNEEFEAILGFSQGSRLAHIISILHTITNGAAFPGLKYVVHFSGYGDCPMPDNFGAFLKNRWVDNISPSVLSKLNNHFEENYNNFDHVQVNLPSLHVMGLSDKLIPLKSSEALLKWYAQPSIHVHPGSHFVPVKKSDMDAYILFFNKVVEITNPPLTPPAIAVDRDRRDNDGKGSGKSASLDMSHSKTNIVYVQPDEEHAQTQIDEVTALAQIFPGEFRLLSNSKPRDTANYDPDDYFDENRLYEHPIMYSIELLCTDSEQSKIWPPKELSVCIQYPAEYPDVAPTITLLHDMNYLEFSMQASDALLGAMQKAIEDEAGMPCGMGMVYAARAFFEDGGLASCKKKPPADEIIETIDEDDAQSNSGKLRPSSAARIKECNAQGLQIASSILGRARSDDTAETAGKGGRWHYTLGLVGKPSAGKSTFFNAATAFARQRGEGGGEARCEDEDDNDVVLGGASMAPHPFTTIDPNVGYCLIPAPSGACPEDEEDMIQSGLVLGSTHGRDSKGRRFVPVMLKDVAGLVPGAYQGRGRGNKFLDDLTDADVLVHIVDASGSSDAEGNRLYDLKSANDLNHPLNDLEWVRNELVKWVYHNISSKWYSINRRRGKQKFVGMFSGYKQRQSFTQDVFEEVENFVFENEGREAVFDHLETWDEGDLHRLVSAFLGARFPMALALNKGDIPTAAQYIKEIKSKLPIHGAHTGVGLSAHEEMKFVRYHVALSSKSPSSTQTKSRIESTGGKVWDCLQSAVDLRAPTLIFPVNDMSTYEPLPGMTNYATRDSSLPNLGFISCITAAGGLAPSQWDSQRMIYTPNTKDSAKTALRDVVLLKPGSTVEDVFQGLKGMGALEGEYVRAEGAFRIGDKPKPVSKSEVVTRHNRILRIMTTKRREWQSK